MIRLLKKIELYSNSNPEYLRLIRATIDQVCQIAGFNRLESSKIVLAVDEACSNVIRHAYLNEPDQEIYIKCTIEKNLLRIKIVDHGIQVDPKKIKPRPLDEIRPGGLGVHLIKSVMDRVRYKNLVDSGNELTMIKYMTKGE
ncbi:ATP-binding protein [candidate division KSB1 bacterium]|nr:ATP-binding protein [candidate division KSB1 bacterium]